MWRKVNILLKSQVPSSGGSGVKGGHNIFTSNEDLYNQLIYYKQVCRTARAKRGIVIIFILIEVYLIEL